MPSSTRASDRSIAITTLSISVALVAAFLEIDVTPSATSEEASFCCSRTWDISSILDVAARTGLQNPKKRDMSLVLGTGEQSLLNMTASYAVLANGGNSVFPYAIFEISDQEGDILYSHDAEATSRQFLSKDIRNIQKMLHYTVEVGTGKKAWILNVTKGGKTGTTQNFRDAWFIGYTENLVAGVWMGNDNNAPMKNVTGGSYPATLWRDIMRNNHATIKGKADGKASSPFSSLLKGLLN